MDQGPVRFSTKRRALPRGDMSIVSMRQRGAAAISFPCPVHRVGPTEAIELHKQHRSICCSWRIWNLHTRIVCDGRHSPV
jgi:hypothetical protein